MCVCVCLFVCLFVWIHCLFRSSCLFALFLAFLLFCFCFLFLLMIFFVLFSLSLSLSLSLLVYLIIFRFCFLLSFCLFWLFASSFCFYLFNRSFICLFVCLLPEMSLPPQTVSRCWIMLACAGMLTQFATSCNTEACRDKPLYMCDLMDCNKLYAHQPQLLPVQKPVICSHNGLHNNAYSQYHLAKTSPFFAWHVCRCKFWCLSDGDTRGLYGTIPASLGNSTTIKMLYVWLL